MKTEDDKLNMLIGLIKRSEPVMKDQKRFTEKVIENIEKRKRQPDLLASLNELLFGWVYVGWVRRSLVAVSLAILFFFGYQQAVLLKRVNELSDRRIEGSASMVHGITTNYSGKLRLYRLFGERALEKNSNISEDKIEDFVRQVYELNSEYQDLIEEMKKDSSLKKYVGEKMEEMNRKKSKI
jgi:hypothetical protein